MSRERRYCGEPDIVGCEDCIADLGGLLEEDIPVRALVRRSSADLARSRRIVAPSRDAAQRLQRHFPTVRPEIVAWEDDADLPEPGAPRHAGTRRICVVGAIGVEKGYDVLLGCVRDAARRQLPLEFVVCGYTADDARLLEAGPVFITGEYKEAEAIELIRSQAAHLAFIPSVWPETWCFALSRAWQAGLMAVAFDLGAQAERIRATGRGRLLPLGLSSRAVNDALLSLAPPKATSQSPPRPAS
ncbi:MAG: glycosyltransferase [Acetobacteraceae bacterium]|nr:glycosyltransferase [Acetobacteraceae bacterium]